MNKQIAAAIALAMGFTSGFASAAPTCQMNVAGSDVTVTILDTGLVYTGGKQPPQGTVTYPGTGRQGDVAASCSDNAGLCKAVQFYARPADAKWGWAADPVIDSDARVIRGQYDPAKHAMSFRFKLVPEMLNANGKLRLHFAGKDPAGNIVAAYQPQGGNCVANNNSTTSDPHVELTVLQQPTPQPR